MDLVLKYIPVLTPLILAVSAAFAYLSLRSAARTARQKATLDLIEKFETDEKYRRIQTAFKRHRNDGTLLTLNAPQTASQNDDRWHVIDFLNHYELIAIGIRNKTLDADFYGQWMRGPLVRDWNDAADFIQRERWKFSRERGEWVYYDKVFENFGWLALFWDSQAVRLTKSYSQHPEAPKGPSDRHYGDRPNMVNQS